VTPSAKQNIAIAILICNSEGKDGYNSKSFLDRFFSCHAHFGCKFIKNYSSVAPDRSTASPQHATTDVYDNAHRTFYNKSFVLIRNFHSFSNFPIIPAFTAILSRQSSTNFTIISLSGHKNWITSRVCPCCTLLMESPCSKYHSIILKTMKTKEMHTREVNIVYIGVLPFC
jgi:hypothetical protein